MNSVASVKASVKPSVSDACHWIEQKGKGGELKGKTAQLWVTAIKALASALREDEPDEAAFVLANIDELARRWGNLHPENRGETIRTYVSRCRSGLDKFLRWQDDPRSVTFASREPRERASRPAQQAPVTEVPLRPQAAGAELRTFPLGEGRSVQFTVPPDFESRDVRRFACHLLTLARDFDPTEPVQAQFFSVVRRPES